MKLLRLTLTFLVLFSFAACGEKDPDPKLSINLESKALSFNSDGTDSYTIQVTTNQSSWDAVSDQTWCEIAKKEGEFVVTAKANTSTEAPAPAKITVIAGKATPIVINVTQSGRGAMLSVSPEGPLAFSADGTESHTIEVDTNQPSWEAVSDNPVFTIEDKKSRSFVVRASQNLTKEEVTGRITVSAPNTSDVVILVKQEGKEEGEVSEDNGKTIWEDTHWRLFGLKGNPKSISNERGVVLEFNSDGRITNNNGDFYEYDNVGRIVKMHYSIDEDDYVDRTFNAVNAKTAARSVGMLRSSSRLASNIFEYGTHTKYIPLPVEFIDPFNGNDILYLLKGVSAIVLADDAGVETGRMELNIADTSVKGHMKSSDGDVDLDITYSGDYPVKAVFNMAYPSIPGNMSAQNINEFSYGINYKYAKKTSKTLFGKEGEQDILDEGTILYKEDGIYLLPVKREDSSPEEGYSEVTQLEYDKEGRLIKVIEPGYIVILSDYKNDSKGNWIERTMTDPGGSSVEKRTITYH